MVAGKRGPPAGRPSEPSGVSRQRTAVWQESYLSSTVAPASSSWDLIDFASSSFTPSLTVLGAPSTRSFASLRPRPVTARTTLITWIFWPPALESTTSKEVFSSAAAAPSPPAATAPGAATATGAAAVMPHSSSIFFFSSTSSRTVIFPSSSKTVSTPAIVCLLLRVVGFGVLFGDVRHRLAVGHCASDRRRALAAELLDAGVDQPDQVLQRGVDQRRERRDDGAEHLAAQRLERRELRELVDVLGRDLPALHEAAADREDARLPR